MEGKGKISSTIAARMAAGEVFVPVLAGTLTTLAPFFPLLFWPGIIGKFMVYLPTMLIFTLAASLLVAFIMNPVFAVDFMNHADDEGIKRKSDVFKKPFFLFLVASALILYVSTLFPHTSKVIIEIELNGATLNMFFANLLSMWKQG